MSRWRRQQRKRARRQREWAAAEALANRAFSECFDRIELSLKSLRIQALRLRHQGEELRLRRELECL